MWWINAIFPISGNIPIKNGRRSSQLSNKHEAKKHMKARFSWSEKYKLWDGDHIHDETRAQLNSNKWEIAWKPPRKQNVQVIKTVWYFWTIWSIEYLDKGEIFNMTNCVQYTRIWLLKLSLYQKTGQLRSLIKLSSGKCKQN